MRAGSVRPGNRFEAARAVADAILYEGYLLCPYRRSSVKNRMRWQFGVLAPHAWAAARGLTDVSVAGSAESAWQQTECLLTAPDDAIVHLRLRFLHLRRRTVEEFAADGSFRPTGSLETAWGTEFSFDEAEPREYDLSASVGELLAGPVRLNVAAPGGGELTPLPDSGGRLTGRLRRRLEPVAARVRASAEVCPNAGNVPAAGQTPPGPRLIRLRVLVENVCENLPVSAPRDQALAVSPLAAHLLAALDRGSFISLLDPPQWAEAAAKACANVRTFPVLAGEPGTSDLVLSSPILLPDHPQVAPESPGDLHDATEIDEILSLRALKLTEEEKREARATDRRAAAILDRVDAMPPEALARLHGAVRSLRPARRPAAGAAGAAAEAGAAGLSKGARVRLRPKPHGTDAQDMFLAGRSATVEAVLDDVDGGLRVAVTLDDDPGADLGRWYGRFRYFSPEEVEPLPLGGRAG